MNDLLPVENISATATPHALCRINYQGALTEEKVASLKHAASQQLFLDPTRPSKARCYIKPGLS